MASAAVRLQTELDDTKSCFQFTKTMTKVEKQNNHRLDVFTNKNITVPFLWKCMTDKMSPMDPNSQ